MNFQNLLDGQHSITFNVALKNGKSFEYTFYSKGEMRKRTNGPFMFKNVSMQELNRIHTAVIKEESIPENFPFPTEWEKYWEEKTQIVSEEILKLAKE